MRPGTGPAWRSWAFLIRLAKRSLEEFYDDRCPQLAAAISFHVLLSLFPLAIVVTATVSVVVNVLSVQADLIDSIVRQVPLTPDGKRRLTDLLEGATSSGAGIGLVGVVGLLWAGTGVMTSLRFALNRAWDSGYTRPFLKGKALDLALMGGLATLLLASVASTVAVRVLSDRLPHFLSGLSGSMLGLLLPLALAFATALALYRLVPATSIRVRDVWPGALFAAFLLLVLQNLFGFYLRNFGSYSVVYGSLGAVIAFLVFVYLSANFLLLGAEVASEWPRVLRSIERGEQDGDDRPPHRRVLALLRGLVVKDGGREREAEGSRSRRARERDR